MYTIYLYKGDILKERVLMKYDTSQLVLITIYVEPQEKEIDAWRFSDLKHIFFTLYTI